MKKIEKSLNIRKHRFFDDIALIALALISIGLLVFELTNNPSAQTLHLIRVTDIAIALIFLVEFFFRLAESKNKKGFWKENWWQLFASIPVTTSGTQILRGLMFIRLFRIIRVTSLAVRINFFSKSLSRFLKETRLAYIITFLILALLGGSLTFYRFEAPYNPLVNTFFDSFLFASGVMTSAGGGAIEPMTSGGRSVAIFLMFSGTIIFGLFIAFISSYLVTTKRDKTK